MIEVKNLVKRYGENTAVRGVSFTVEPGRIYGFLGPNGAGKSTTMNIITGCLAATEGEVVVNGHDIYEEPVEAKAAIGYLPEQPPLYLDMTPREYLEFVGRAKGLSGDKLYRAADEAIEETGLTAYADRLISKLSKGYRQRVGIAQAIIGDPEIIILDEPTVGLDPRQIIEIRDLIRELGRGHTVILSSHILTEISEVCDYVIIIAKGRIVASDTLENLTKLYEGKNYVDMLVRGDADRARRIIESIRGADGIQLEPSESGRLHVRIAVDKDTDIREELFFRFADAKMPILQMAFEEVTLEKVFLELTGDRFNPADQTNDGSDGNAEHPADDMVGMIAAQAMKNAAVLDNSPSDTDSSDEGDKDDAAHGDMDHGSENKSGGKKASDDDYKPLFGGN